MLLEISGKKPAKHERQWRTEGEGQDMWAQKAGV